MTDVERAEDCLAAMTKHSKKKEKATFDIEEEGAESGGTEAVHKEAIKVPPLELSSEKDEKEKRLRIKVLEEIVTTERAYVNDLNLILKNFVVPLKKLITDEDSAIIFSNISTIHSVHQTIFASLSERAWGLSASAAASAVPSHLQDDKEGELAGSPRNRGSILIDNKIDKDFLIADIFTKNADYLKFYTTYTLNQSESLQAIKRLKQNSVTFNAFLRGMQNKKTDIGSYLIKPVQRICKYPLLLRELLKYTPQSHPDYENLLVALEKVQSVASHVDVHNQRVQNIAKMVEIQRSLFLGKNKFEVVKPSRVFVQEGDFISMKPGTQKLGKPVHAFLFNDVLVVAGKGKDKGDQKTDDTGAAASQITFKFMMRFALKLMQVRELEKPGFETTFELIQPQSAGATGKKARGSLKGSSGIILQAMSLVEKQKWVLAINKCKKELQAKIMAQIQATSDSKKGRASTMVPNLNYYKKEGDDESTNEDELSNSESPRLTRTSMDSLTTYLDDSKDRGSETTATTTTTKNPLLNVPQSALSRSLPSSPNANSRRRSSSYSHLTLTPQPMINKEEKDKDKEKKKDKREKKEKRKRKGSLIEPDDSEGNESGSGRRKNSSRKDLFAIEEDGAGGDGDNNKKEKDEKDASALSGRTKQLRDRNRSRSFNQLPPLDRNKISASSSTESVVTLSNNNNSSSAFTQASTQEPSKSSRSVAFKEDEPPVTTTSPAGSKLLPSAPTRRKHSFSQDNVVDLEEDDGEDDIVSVLRMKLAEQRLKKTKWKQKYTHMRERYEELEKKYAALAISASPRTSSEEERGGGGGGGSAPTTPKRAGSREREDRGGGQGSLESLNKMLATLNAASAAAAASASSNSESEREMQMLLAQRKNELEEKKRLLESKKKELEEKRKESVSDP